MRMEERASGIDCEETELDQALAEIIEKEEDAEKERNEKQDTVTKNIEKDKATAEYIRHKAMETMGKSDDCEYSKPGKKRKSMSDAVDYLREKFEAEKKVRMEELEVRKTNNK